MPQYSDVEYAIELLPSYSQGIQILLANFGYDALSKCDLGENFFEAHLLVPIWRQQPNVCRKLTEPLPQARKPGVQLAGFINVCRQFLHCSLIFVNPPHGWVSTRTQSFINDVLSKLLEGIANQDLIEIRFKAAVQEGEAHGGRKIFFICSKDGGLRQGQLIQKLREDLRKIFQENGFRVRQPAGAVDELHMTIRDERYETKTALESKPRVPSKPGVLRLTFDTIAMTPAAMHDPRHSFKRQFCGVAFACPIYPRAEPLSPQEDKVIDDVRHVEAAAPVSKLADAVTSGLLEKTFADGTVSPVGLQNISLENESIAGSLSHDLSENAPSKNPTSSSGTAAIRVGSNLQPQRITLTEMTPHIISGRVPSKGTIGHPDCWNCSQFQRGNCQKGEGCHKCHAPNHEASPSRGRQRFRAAKQKARVRIPTPDQFE